MPRSENIIQTLGPLGWAIAVAMLVLLCAAIVLAVVAIRYLVLRTPEASISPQRRSAAVNSRAPRPGQRNGTAGSATDASASGRRVPLNGVSVSPVPPENPHSPPTPALGTRPNRL